MGVIPISCTEGYGLEFLLKAIEKRMMSITGRKVVTFRVPTGGSEYDWLRRNVAFSQIKVDESNDNYSLIVSVVSDADLQKFRNAFIKDESSLRQS